MNALEFKEIRKSLGFTQEKMANALGVDRRTIINYEQGSVIPESKVKLIHLLTGQSEKVEFVENKVSGDVPLGESLISEKNIPAFIVENESRLMESKTFKLWLTTKIQEGVIKILSSK